VASYAIHGAVSSDGVASYAIHGAVSSDGVAAYAVHGAVSSDGIAGYSIASASGCLTVADIPAIAAAVWGHASAVTLLDRVAIAHAILRNKTVTDPATGTMTVYADNGVTPLLTAQLYEDVAGSQTYRGQGAEVRERLA
jgi:hypothetical protein